MHLRAACCGTFGTGPDHPLDYIVAVVFHGHPMHQLVARSDDGWHVNTNATGCDTLDELVDTLRSVQPYWPVALTEFVRNKGGIETLVGPVPP